MAVIIILKFVSWMFSFNLVQNLFYSFYNSKLIIMVMHLNFYFYFSLISFLIIVLDLVDYFDIFVNFDLCWLIKVNSWSLSLVDILNWFDDLHGLALLELWNFRLWSLGLGWVWDSAWWAVGARVWALVEIEV